MHSDARERDTIPVPAAAVLSEAPPWAAELIQEVRGLSGALIATNEELIAHVGEMARLRRAMRRLELAQLAYEHRTHQLEQLAPVVPLHSAPPKGAAANG
jgi:hypothetical protein